ncbi:MAG: 2-phosphosulfolactate phosphatase [Chloroflexi bacterium]|nr:2-phosphosulfolactate phosphatase [Chloroflexota bacterium]
MMYFDQQEYEVSMEWGLAGVEALAPHSDVMIIVDVLSFTTCVDIAIGRGGVVYPYRGTAEALPEFAASRGALYAAPNRAQHNGFSLSPSSLVNLPRGTRLVLPSPNGSKLSLSTGNVPTLAGSLRNAKAVAHIARQFGTRIGVVAAGERWPDGSLRPALEDLLGAGAIIAHINGQRTRSPEAEVAMASFWHLQADLQGALLRCGSGKELVGRGFAEDVHLAAQHNASSTAPILSNGAYQQVGSSLELFFRHE